MILSQFAKRFTEAGGTQQLMDDLGNAKHAANFVAMLGGGNPAHIPAIERVLQQQLLTIANDSHAFASTFGEYDAPQGCSQFIASLAQFLTERMGCSITPENIAITNGSQSSFIVLFNCFAGQGEDGIHRKILLPFCPEYIGYQETNWQSDTLFESRKPLIVKLNNGYFKYRINFEELGIDPNQHGAVCISRPTNPTGNVVADDELQLLALECEQHNVPLIIDGAYGLPFPNIVFTHATPFWNSNTILCLSLSKLGLPATRTGIVVAKPDVIQLVRAANAASCLAPGSIGTAIVEPLLRDGSLLSLCKKHITPFYEQRMQHAVKLLQQQLSQVPLHIHIPEGAIFLWLWFEGLPITSEQLYEQLKQKGVYVLAGEHFFGNIEHWPHKYECIRLNYAAEPELLEKGIRILAETVNAAYSV